MKKKLKQLYHGKCRLSIYKKNIEGKINLYLILPSTIIFSIVIDIPLLELINVLINKFNRITVLGIIATISIYVIGIITNYNKSINKIERFLEQIDFLIGNEYYKSEKITILINNPTLKHFILPLIIGFLFLDMGFNTFTKNTFG